MAIVIASVPTAANYDTKKRNIQNSLAGIGETSLQDLRMKFYPHLNTVLSFSGSLKPPTGTKFNLLEDSRTNVATWQDIWVYDLSPNAENVTAIMEGFGNNDKSCSQ